MNISQILLLCLPVAFAMPVICQTGGCQTTEIHRRLLPKFQREQAKTQREQSQHEQSQHEQSQHEQAKTGKNHHGMVSNTPREYFLEQQRALALLYRQINRQIDVYLGS